MVLASFSCVAAVIKDGGVIRATFRCIYEGGDTKGAVIMIHAVVGIIEAAEVGEFFGATIYCVLAFGDVWVGDPLGKFIGEFGKGAIERGRYSCRGFSEFRLKFDGFEGVVAEGEVIHFVGMDIQLEITLSFIRARFIVGYGDLFPE